jgi:hypothetical protein
MVVMIMMIIYKHVCLSCKNSDLCLGCTRIKPLPEYRLPLLRFSLIFSVLLRKYRDNTPALHFTTTSFSTLFSPTAIVFDDMLCELLGAVVNQSRINISTP